MSAITLSRYGCTLALGAALASLFSGAAASQALSYQGRSFLPIERDGSIRPDALPESAPDDQLSAPLRRQVVSYQGAEAPGTVIIDTAHTFLYLTLGGGKALRYGIGVGRQGFTWSGIETISRKSEWPDWIPPSEMIARQPYLPRWVSGGPGNPLGARALYLGNTAYRIHGTNNPASIGKHVSSGCIRLRNEDVVDLYERIGVGTKVIVLPNDVRHASLEGRAAIEAHGSREGRIASRDYHAPAIVRGNGAQMTARIPVAPAAEQVAQVRTTRPTNSKLDGIY